jgi:tetratricopeptide (TPR) repeat protein
MEVAVVASQLRSLRFGSLRVAAAFSLLAAPLLCGCSGFLTKYEDRQTQGLRLYQEKNYTEAAGAFRNAVRKDPRDYKSQYYLAVSCDAEQRYQEAIEAYRACLDIMKVTYDGQDDVKFRQKALDGLAITVAKADTHDTQINAFEKQAKTSRKAEDYFLLAKIFRYRQDADMALENYNHAILLDNRNFPMLKEYGLYLLQLNQSQRAMSTLSQAYRVNDKDEQVIGALRQLGVVPGPSLKEQDELAQPIIPKGPIPPLDLQKIRSGLGLGGNNADLPVVPVAPAPAASIQAPRD